MKKKIFTLLALFTCVLSASADDAITVSSALIPEGKSGTFGIELTNTGGYSGFQVDLNLATDVKFVSVAKTSRIPDDWTFSDNYDSEHPSSTIRIVGHYNKNANPIITGNSGDFLIVTVSLAGSSAKAGDLLPCSLTNMEVTPTGTTTAQKVADFNFNIEVSDKVILDEASTVLPATQDGIDVLVKRTLTKNVWNTICLPFGMDDTQIVDVFGAGVKFAKFTKYAYNSTEDKVTVTFTEFDWANEGWIDPNQPFVVKPTKDVSQFELTAVDVAPDESSSITTVKDRGKEVGKFIGVLHSGETIPADNLFISDNKFWYSKGTTTIKGFRGYFWLKDFKSTSSAPEFVVDGETTNIEGLQIITDDGQLYNLKGQKIDNPTQKGVYIQNGKKVVVK